MSTKLAPAYRAIADSITDDLLSRRLVPGDRLPTEAELAKRFGVARSTIREALRELASRNLVETRRGATGGTFVLTPRPEAVAEAMMIGVELMVGDSGLGVEAMLEARGLLEVPAARFAAARADDSSLDSLRQYAEGASREGQLETGELMTNWHFHALIVKAAQNPLLALMAEPIFRVLQYRFEKVNPSSVFRRRVRDDHRRIAAAVLEGDVEGAGTEMAQHLEFLRPNYRPFDRRLSPR